MSCTNKVTTLDWETLETVSVPCGTDGELCLRCYKLRCLNREIEMIRAEQHSGDFVGFVRAETNKSRRAMAEARRAERALKRRLGHDYE